MWWIDTDSPLTYHLRMCKAYKKMGCFFALTFVAMNVASQSFGQTPNIGDALRQTEPPKTSTRSTQELPIQTNQPQGEMPKADGEETIFVNRFVFTDNKSIASDQLEEITAKFLNKDLSLSQIQFVADIVTQYYRQNGYFLARAILPPQDVVDGVVTVKLIEGTLGELRTTNNSLVKDSVVEDVMGAIGKDSSLNLYSLERRLLIVNNLPGATIKDAQVSAGQRPETTDLVVTIDKAPRINGFVVADNYGSNYIGRHRLSAGVDINSPFGLGDKISLGGLISEGQYLKNYRASYSSLLPPSGLTGQISASRTSYELGDSFDSLDAVGTADIYEAGISYPFIFTRDFILTGGLGFAHKDLQDEIHSTSTSVPKSINSISPNIGVSFKNNMLGFEGHSTLDASITIGHLDIEESTAAALDASGARTEGDFVKTNFHGIHQIQFNKDWSASFSLAGQNAYGKNLDGVEDMSIAGMSGVRAYPSDEFSAENAYVASTEFLYALPTTQPDLSLRMGPFADIGYAHVENKIGANSSRTLSDIGVGAYASCENFFFNAKLAHAMTSEAESDSVPDTRLYFQTGVKF